MTILFSASDTILGVVLLLVFLFPSLFSYPFVLVSRNKRFVTKNKKFHVFAVQYFLVFLGGSIQGLERWLCSRTFMAVVLTGVIFVRPLHFSGRHKMTEWIGRGWATIHQESK